MMIHPTKDYLHMFYIVKCLFRTPLKKKIVYLGIIIYIYIFFFSYTFPSRFMIRPFPVWVNQVTAPCDFCCGKVFMRLIEYCIYPISSLCYRMSPQRQLFLVKKRNFFVIPYFLKYSLLSMYTWLNFWLFMVTKVFIMS